MRNRLFPPGGRRWQLYLGLRDATRRTLRLPGWAASGLLSWLRRARAAASRPARRRLRQRAGKLAYRPLISILTPVYNVERRWLRAMIESVRGQAYPHWELCLVDDASTAPHIRAELAHWAARDARLKVKFLDHNRGIAGASNECLALASGEFAALLDHDDLLTPDALLEVVELLNRDPSWDLIYSDEDKVSDSGACYDPVWKTGWNPSLLLTCNYITHLGVYRTQLLRQIDGFRAGFDGSQDYDLVLRFTEQTKRIAHIPRVLYHWRVIPTSTAASALAKPYAYVAGRRAIEQALQRRGRPAPVEIHTPGHYRVHHPVPDGAAVSLIVHPLPGADCRIDLEGLMRSIAGSWNLEWLVVTAAGQQLPEDTSTIPVRTVVQRRDQSLTATLNEAVRQANSRHLVFLHSGVRPIRSSWLIALHEQFQPGVAAVGARLVGRDSRLLHAGLMLDANGRPHSPNALLHESGLNQMLYTEAVRNCSAVGGGCLAIDRFAFEQVGGFDERFVGHYHDVDLCLRLQQADWQIVYTPWAELQQTVPLVPAPTDADDFRHFRARWAEQLPVDPFCPPMLRRAA